MIFLLYQLLVKTNVVNRLFSLAPLLLMKTLNHTNGCSPLSLNASKGIGSLHRSLAQKCIITDQSLAMKNAIDAVLPNTIHRFFIYIWHIMNKFDFQVGNNSGAASQI
jgi:hypothetical protein